MKLETRNINLKNTKSRETAEKRPIATQNIQNDEAIELEKKANIFSWFSTVVFTIIFVSVLTAFLFRIAPVDGLSMFPTLNNADQLITTPLHGKIKRHDIVVIRRNGDTALIKRVIGVEGDIIDINFETSEVFVNGIVQDEPYINEPTTAQLDFSGPVTVPDGHIFVMGDNRNHSGDSRESRIGMIDTRNVYGKVFLRIFPLDKFGKVL